MDRDDKLQKKKDDIAYFETFEVIDNKIYAFLWWKNILIKIFPDSDETEILMLDDTYFFKHCTTDGEKIYFADNYGEALVIYDVDSKLREEYILDANIKDDNNIVTVENYAGNIFVVENFRGNIYIFNKSNKNIEKDCALCQKIKRTFKTGMPYIYCWKIGNYLYFKMVSEDAHEIFKYNLEKRSLENIQEVVLPEQIMGSYYFEDKLFMLQDDFNIIVWNIKDSTIDKIELMDLHQLLGENKPKYIFSSIAVTKRNIWLLPSSMGKDIYIYDLQKKCVRKYDDYPSDFFYLEMKDWSKYSEIKEREGFIYIAARSSNYYLIIDVDRGIGIWKPAYMNDFGEYYNYYMDKLEPQSGNVSIERCIPLKVQLNYFPRKMQDKINKKGLGKKIWGELK